MEGEKPLKIGELAQKASVTVQTVRYYERLGLLHAQRKGPNGIRTFWPYELERLKVIKALQSLDIPLERIKELMEMRPTSESGSGGQVRLTSALDSEIQRIDKKIMEYLEVKRSLLEVVEEGEGCLSCQAKPATEVCGVCQRPIAGGKDRRALLAFT